MTLLAGEKRKSEIRLRAIIGASGFKTRDLETDRDLCVIASQMFEVLMTDDIEAMLIQLEPLGSRRRGELGRNFMGKPQTGKTDSELLHKVVMAVINNGHASDLYDMPDVLKRFGYK